MQSQEQPRDVMHDFRGSVNMAVVAMFCISGTGQLYSRREVGRLFFGWMTGVGVFLQAIYTVFKQGDVVVLQALLGIHSIAFALHGMQRLRAKHQGIELHSYDPGYGVLSPLLPAFPIWGISLLSDLFMAGSLAAFFHFVSPVQRDWYLYIVMPSLLISQCWVRARERYLKQQHVDAAVQARHYAQTIGRR